jgi:enterochelin esterase-like enzyme
MHAVPLEHLQVETHEVESIILKRSVKLTCYQPITAVLPAEMSLLLVNDGQDLVTMGFEHMLEQLFATGQLEPVLVVGIHCSTDRKNEYGTARVLDYKGRGAKANKYQRFVFGDLLPFLRETFQTTHFRDKAMVGFSLGGLSAIDLAWQHPHEFRTVGVFSGSFWWRDRDQDDPDFNEQTDRIMHRLIREGSYYPWMRFFFQTGALDEVADRNNNGIIDAIDDTLALIDELKAKGYTNDQVEYLELADGKHDVPTWARAFPAFLKWGWGKRV